MQRNAIVGLTLGLLLGLGLGLAMAGALTTGAANEAVTTPKRSLMQVAAGVYTDPLGFVSVPVTSPPQPAPEAGRALMQVAIGVYADPLGFVSIPVTSPPQPAPEAKTENTTGTTEDTAQAA